MGLPSRPRIHRRPAPLELMASHFQHGFGKSLALNFNLRRFGIDLGEIGGGQLQMALLQESGSTRIRLSFGRTYAAISENCCLSESAFGDVKTPCCLRIM